MVVPSLAELDHVLTLGDAPGRAAQRRTAALVAHPVDRVVVPPLGGEQVSPVLQTEPAPAILDELQLRSVPYACVHSRQY